MLRAGGDSSPQPLLKCLLGDHYPNVALNPDSRHTIYAGTNYVFAPTPILDGERFLSFQQALSKHGLSFERAERPAPAQWILARGKPPLTIQAGTPAPPIGQVMVVSEWMEGEVDTFADDAALVYDAVFETWPGDKQVIAKDATVRQLYDVGGKLAFEYLWEHRLGQQVAQLGFLGKHVGGGGLRLVMPPDMATDEPVQTELRIESFLADPRKLFVQVTMAWPKPDSVPSSAFAPAELLSQVKELANGDVLEFLQLKGA